jgi:hypothetical protein
MARTIEISTSLRNPVFWASNLSGILCQIPRIRSSLQNQVPALYG